MPPRHQLDEACAAIREIGYDVCARVNEFLSLPLTRTAIADILDAVSS